MPNQLSYIVWKKETFSVSDEGLDAQHLQIVELINRIYASRNDEGGVSMREILTAIDRYTVEHFLAEEAYLLQIAYPALEDHMRFHKEMRRRTRNILNSFLADPQSFDLYDAFDFLKNWWSYHILNEDMRYARHAREREDARRPKEGQKAAGQEARA